MKEIKAHIRILAGVKELLAQDKNSSFDIAWPIYKIKPLHFDLEDIFASNNSVLIFTSKASLYALLKTSKKESPSLFSCEKNIKIAAVGEFTAAYIKNFYKVSSVVTPKKRGLQNFFREYYNLDEMFFVLTGKNSQTKSNFYEKNNVRVQEVYELLWSKIDFQSLLALNAIDFKKETEFSFICKSKDILVQVLKSLSSYLKCTINDFPENIHFELWEKSAKSYAKSIALKFRDYR
jgi:hypothetical protein